MHARWSLLVATLLLAAGRPVTAAEYDVVVYGGTSAGVMAAVQAKRMGKAVVLVSPDRHLGGLSSGGIGFTDTGDKSVIGGLARDFYHRVWRHYDDASSWRWQRKFDPIPNLKTDTNNHGPFSFDNIGASHEYPEASYERRRAILKEHETYQKGLLYFIATDPRVPEGVRREMRRWGLAKDEFTDNGHWPHQIYVREARRMVGAYVMTEHDLTGRRTTPKPVGMGSYTMEPAFMILGQSAATAAVLAIDGNTTVQDVSYEALRARLLSDGQVLEVPQPTP